MKIKQRILEGLRRNNGACSGAWLFAFVYGKRAPFIDRTALKAHIWQLRKLGYPIVASARGPSRYEWEDGSVTGEAHGKAGKTGVFPTVAPP